MKFEYLTLKTVILLSITCISTITYAGPGHGHAEKNGNQAGGHMDHMNNVLKTLKRDLGKKYSIPVPATNKKQLVMGKKIFTQSCVACHGTEGKGNGPAAVSFNKKPSDFTDAEHSKYYSDQGRIYIIKKGIANTPMAGWENILSENEIRSVHAYIRSLRSTDKKQKHGHGHSHHNH